MDLRTFRARTYAKHSGQLYVFEPTWDSFRPISKIGWDGKRYAYTAPDHTQNLFSPHYGFASLEEKRVCADMAASVDMDTSVETTDPDDFMRWAGLRGTEWFRDRPCVFLSPCSSRNWKEYLGYLNSRPRTLRRDPRGRLTRRRSKRLVAE